MSQVNYNLLTQDGLSFLTVYPPNATPLVASSESHANFDELVRAVLANDESVYDKFDVQRAVQAAFDRVSERVSVRDGKVYFDGDEVNNTLTDKILRFYENAEEDYEPLVLFMEKLSQNPEENSREQLFRFLDHYDVPLTEDGDIVFYKAVKSDGNGGWTSMHAGPAIVDGVEVNGYVPNAVGSVVEIGRSLVDSDPNVACNTGLHAGTYEYASQFGRGHTHAIMTVRVNPRDVVSVPHDYTSQKVRVCRYEVLDIVQDKYEDSVQVVHTGNRAGTPVTAFGKVDTRENHKSQQRDANGRFIPKHRR